VRHPTTRAIHADPGREARLQALLAAGGGLRWRAAVAGAGVAGTLLYAATEFGLLGMQFVDGLGNLGSALVMMLPPSGYDQLPTFGWALLETVAMALLGTALAAALAAPLALLAARTTCPLGILQFGFRRFADSLRALDYLIWALVFVRAVGLGPLAGILAIAVVDLGTLIKLFSEAIDNTPRGPVEGVRATGGRRLDQVFYGMAPQVLPTMVSATLYMWESNTRSATILGIVGAGGIGYYLADRLRVYEWGEASLLIVLILLAVYLIDIVASRLRGRLIRGA
jgi:phosphonate transport system permease protein